MKPHLRDRFERLAMRLNELDASLSDPAVAADSKRWRSLSREQAEVGEVVALFRRYQQRESDLAGARELLADGAGLDDDMRAMAGDEVTAASADLEQLDADLQAALLPRVSSVLPRLKPSSRPLPPHSPRQLPPHQPCRRQRNPASSAAS